MRLSACIEWLFAEGDAAVADRIGRAAAAGLAAVEFWGWRDKDLAAVGDALERHGVELTACLAEPRGRLVDPATHPAFVEGVGESARAAVPLGCRHLIVLAGDALVDASRQAQHDAVVEALRAAAPVAQAEGATLLLEPLNTRVDHPGYFLDDTEEGLAVVDEVGSPAVRLLHDLYHSVVMGESPSQLLAGRVDRVGHVHIADTPGRHEPGSGTIDWDEQLRWLVDAGYRGPLGLEYRPSTDTASSLEHLLGVVAALPDQPDRT